MKSISTVYFLGAGASKDAGVPLTNDLLQIIADQNKKKMTGLVKRFIETFGVSKKEAAGRPPIVDLISLLDSCLRTNRPLDQYFTVERLKEVRNQLIVELSDVMHKPVKGAIKVKMPEDALDQPGAKGRKLAKYFKSFARQLNPRNRMISKKFEPGDAIITTNYDTNIDVALYELVYWEESGGKANYSNITDLYLGSNFRDPYTDENALSEPGAVIDLLKLHGSFNWLYCPLCTRIYIAAFGRSVRFLTGDKKTKEERTCFCGYYRLEPVIIAPSVFQDVVNPHLQAIWMEAYQILENSDKWVFIGYSLPAEDLAVRTMLHRARSARKKIQCTFQEICVIDPAANSDEFKSRYVNLFGNNVKFDNRGFRQYLNDPPCQ